MQSSITANIFPTYPATDPGFAVVAIDDLLSGEADLIARIKLCYGSDRETFEREVVTLLRRYAACVHLLPATADNYFNTPGGLLRLGLETAFFSLQGTDAHIFSGQMSITTRRQLEPRWRHATFIAGLCCELHRLMSHMIVTDAGGNAWSAYLQPLAEWLAVRGVERYFVRWQPQAIETRGLGLFALGHVVTPAVMTDLSAGNSVIVPHLLASISGIPLYREHNVLDALVRRSLALVIDRNLVANADRYGSPQYGSHLERYLVDALRRLARGHPAWVPNREKSRLWFGQDGLFLAWPGAAEDIRQLLETDQLAGIPKAPETLMELLLATGVFEATTTGLSIRTIQPPDTKAPLEAVKLSTPAILLAGIDPAPAPLPQTLECTSRKEPPITASPVSAPVTNNRQHLFVLEPVPEPASSAMPIPDEETTQLPSASAAHEATIALQAPLRLNPGVRDALAAAVRTLNDGMGPPVVCTVAQGVFVPLDAFTRHGIQPALALRSLIETKLLVKLSPNGPPTFTREFNGDPAVGLVIDPRCIRGLDPAGFVIPASES